MPSRNAVVRYDRVLGDGNRSNFMSKCVGKFPQSDQLPAENIIPSETECLSHRNSHMTNLRAPITSMLAGACFIKALFLLLVSSFCNHVQLFDIWNETTFWLFACLATKNFHIRQWAGYSIMTDGVKLDINITLSKSLIDREIPAGWE